MRQVVGKATHDVDAATFDALREGYDALVLDVGTGDGKHVLHVARERPTTLVVGLDSSPDVMRRTAHRAAAKPAKGGTPNARFVWAAVEQLPAELTGVTEVHVHMPWGSLLRAVVEPDPVVMQRITDACVRDARFEVVLNLHAWRPSVPEVGDTVEPTPESIVGSLATVGWRVDEAGYGARRRRRPGRSVSARAGPARPRADQLGNWRQYSYSAMDVAVATL